MAKTRTSPQRANARSFVTHPDRPGTAGYAGRPSLPRWPPPQVAWSVFAIEPDGSSARIESGLTAAKALDRSRQLWCAEQDNGGDRDFAPGLSRPSTDLAEQEVREIVRWMRDGKPRPWDYD